MAPAGLKGRLDIVPAEPGVELAEPVARTVAQQAVFNALKVAERDGCEPDQADACSLRIDDVEATDVDRTT
jgi:hypothetical protein